MGMLFKQTMDFLSPNGARSNISECFLIKHILKTIPSNSRINVPIVKPECISEYIHGKSSFDLTGQMFLFCYAASLALWASVSIRDLAARNILMASDKVLKISDFGLSRVGTYVSSIGQKLPLRWMSIEAIEEKTCDNKSDVWSFGVVLWEIGTLGALPYQKTPNSLVLYNLKMGKRLERPRICTDELYTLMLNCWNETPGKRPTFCGIVQQLDCQKKKVYLDFSVLNPTYIFPSAAEEST